MSDFWISSGYDLLDREEGGGLKVTDDFLRAYLARPELVPPEDACTAERALHEALFAQPQRQIGAAEIAAIADEDARENWEVMLAFRDHLVRHRTIEAAYWTFVREGISHTPPMFIDQLVQVILRNALNDCEDAFMLRAAELFFRAQCLTEVEGSLIAADEETVDETADDEPPSPLVAMMGLQAGPEIDVLSEDNAHTYWERSDRFDFALDLTTGREGLAALGRVIRAWVGHMFSVETEVEPLTEIEDDNLTWYVGLDHPGTAIGDALWDGEEVDQDTMRQLVGLYRMTFADPSVVIERVRGKPVYLLTAMTPEGQLQIKPQNLLANLPIPHGLVRT